MLQTIDTPPAEAPNAEVRALLAALEDATREWREELSDVGTDVLIWQVFPGGHSIGALLLHMADVEASWLHEIGAGEARPMGELQTLLSEETDQYQVQWPAPPAQPLAWYYAQQDAVRARTRAIVGKWDNADKVLTRARDGHTFTIRWILSHVVNHDAYHGGAGGSAVLAARTKAILMSSPFVSSKGLRLFTETVGDGPPVLMLNGGPGFSHNYLQETKLLASFARLHYFDQRGTGQSEFSAPPDYTIDANVDDVEAIRQALVGGPCALFGHSWGGMLAQAYAVRFPQNVTKLVLADTFSNTSDLNNALTRMRAAVPPETEAIYQNWEQVGLYADGRDRYPEEYQNALDIAYAPVNLSVPMPPYLEAAFSKLSYPVYRAMWGEETEFRVTGTLAALDVEPHFSKLTMPTLVIVGASDMPSVDMARRTASLLPNARLEVFEHTRHFPFLEEPEKFTTVLRDFLLD